MKDVISLEKEVVSLYSKTNILKEENLELQKLVSLLDDDEVITFEDGRYSDDIQETIMKLLLMNVSMNSVNEVIKVVLNKLAKKNISRLPSAAVKCRLMQEASILGQFQVAEAMLENNLINKNSNIGNSLHGDDTQKYHKHYQNFQITTTSGKTLSFGLSEVVGKDAATVLQNFTNIVDDICDVVSNSATEKEINFAKLITSIKSTMTDLSSVNLLFNSQLKTLREKLLPIAISNWDFLSSNVKDNMKDMSNFFCKLHLLANFASETDKVLNSFEKILLQNDYETVFAFSGKECGAVRLVRTTCKAFHTRGSEEAGVASWFNSFLSSRNDKSYFVPFIGNRFNILYYNAAALYYHKDSIPEFLNAWPNSNNLLKAIKEDITNLVFIAEVCTLGIIDKLLTGPMWRIIESLDSILFLNPYLLRLKVRLSSLCIDASSLLFANGKIFEDTNLLHQDVVYTKLFECTQNDEFDSLTVQSLEIIFHSILVILERQCADQLPGGKYWNPSNSVSEAASNVPVTNKASESDFAILDLMVRTKPNANVQTIQALTMWSQNQTLEWLNSKSDEERKQLLEYSRTKVTLLKSKYDERKEALKKDKAMHLLAKQEEKNREEIKLQHKKVAACNDLINLNVRAWISLEEAEKTVSNIEEPLKSKVLLAQLNFYRIILCVECDKKHFCNTKVEGSKRINLSSKELYQNLLIVIQANLTPNKQSLSNNISNNLKPRTIRDAAVENKKKELMEKIQDARLNKLIEQQKKHSLSKFINNPSDFVGFSIQHRVREEDALKVSWERAQVVQIDQLNGRRTTYLVKYDNEPDEVWSFPLLIDFEKGDLILCS
ncbi:uncharacterized protein LOC136081830 [Hydra vulgaris]|uniref:Uncharacterized protein LOC136081830 n=1 Tax=Hydra vulgaris TaxID=6087 RepID=A0ABM4C3K0_HYDVU